MDAVKITSSLSDLLTQGLDSGALERIGGMIREVATRRIVAFLRDLSPLQGAASELVGFLASGPGVGVLNLGVATMGFVVLLTRVNTIEQRLQRTQELLDQMNQKLDLAFYANFCAALNLADNAFGLRDPENRDAHAMQALGRLMEAKHHYAALVDAQLTSGAHAVDAYLETLCLAHVAEARCYLELEELAMAQRLLDEGCDALRARLRQHVQALLTSNPAAYLHPNLKGKVDLRRLTHVYQWLDPSLDENTVFEGLREQLCDLIQYPEKWVETLPPAVWDPSVAVREKEAPPQPGKKFELPWVGRHLAKLRDLELPTLAQRLPGLGRPRELDVYGHLPTVMETIEGLIEDASRFNAYRAEVHAMQHTGIGFREWRQLRPPPDEPDDQSGVICINLVEPLALTA
jgi:hypothetical protein